MHQSRAAAVLLIEDDEIERLLVRTLLSSRAPMPIELVEAPDLGVGLEQLRRRPFDLVLLDHTLPQLSSLQELRLVLDQRPGQQVILHTGYIEPAVESEARELGLLGVVAKGQLDPLWQAIERVLLHDGGEDSSPENPGGSRNRTVLVVEDEAAVRRIIRMSLELENFTVHEAENGEQALELMHRLGPAIDLVIADLLMPRVGGDQLAQALRRLRPGLPVLLVSGAHDEALVSGVGRLPSDEEILWKPFTPDELNARVTRLLAPP